MEENNKIYYQNHRKQTYKNIRLKIEVVTKMDDCFTTWQ